MRRRGHERMCRQCKRLKKRNQHRKDGRFKDPRPAQQSEANKLSDNIADKTSMLDCLILILLFGFVKLNQNIDKY